MHIDYIIPIPEDKPLHCGIRDLGNFNEGKCIEIIARIPIGFGGFKPNSLNGFAQTWIICNDKNKDKQKLLMMLLKLKVRRQRDFGEKRTT